MKNKILLFLMVLLSAISLVQAEAQATNCLPVPYQFGPDSVPCPKGIGFGLYFYDGITISNCSYYSPGYQTCTLNGSIEAYWTLSPAYGASSPWAPVVGYQYGGGYWDNTPAGQGSVQIQNSNEQESVQVVPTNFYQILENSYIHAYGQFVEDWTDPINGTQYEVLSDLARFINPYNAPLGSPGSGANPSTGSTTNGQYASSVFVPPDKMTLTPDPVNIATGEDYFSSTDFSLNARGPKLALFRKYRSFSAFKGIFGYGWRTDFDVNLTVDGAGNVVIYDGEGTGIYFMNNAATYTPSPGNYSTLTKNSDNTYTLTDKHGTMKHYDLSGRMTSTTDRNGNTLTFVYNPPNFSTSAANIDDSIKNGASYIQDASGRRINLYFGPQGHIFSSEDPAGHTFQYGYDLNGNLVSVTDPTGAVTNYYYDDNHKITQLTNANAHQTYYQYDAQGRAVMTTQANNVNKVTLNYQANNTTVVTDSLGNNNTYVFNSYGLLLSHTDPLRAVTQETWDPMMNQTSLTDARNNVTSFVHDAQGNLVLIIDPLGNQTSMTYTPNFNLISTKTDALNQVTNFVYDIKGNLTAIVDALGNEHHFSYDRYGNVITATDSLGNNTQLTYDAFSHVLQKTDALNDKTIFSYDADGNILTQKDALNHTTSYQYDKLNRFLKNTFADGSKIAFAYDLFGNPISLTDQRGNALTKTYDAYERLTQTKDPNGGITQFNYDAKGDLLKLTDADGDNTTYTYDSDGRVLTKANALDYSTAYTYDLAGNVSTRTDANGKTTNYTYDALNRLTNTTYPDNTKLTNAYDAVGRRISMTDSGGQTTYTYDALNRLLSKEDPGANSTITYTYDSEGNRLTSVDQDSHIITNSYDALDRLVSVRDTNGVTSYAYDADSNEVSLLSPNGVAASYTYDVLNRPLSVVNTKVGLVLFTPPGLFRGGAASSDALSVVISSFNNVYDVAGMITQKTYQDGSWVTYSYDALNRLLEETKKTSTGTINYDDVYTYDALGNRLSWTKNTRLGNFWSEDSATMPPQVLTNMTTAGFGNTAIQSQPLSLVRSYNYDAANRLVKWNEAANIYASSFPIEINNYTYDQNGNRTFKQKMRTGQYGTPQETSYAYDFEDRLSQLNYTNIPSIAGAQTDNLTYSADGLRTQTTRNNVTTDYLYDGPNVVVERDNTGTTTKSYTRGLDAGGGISGIIAQDATNAAVQYYNYDDLGSVTNLTTSTGTATTDYTYDAFGNLLTLQASSDTNTHLFSTKELDSRAGLYYFGARYYDPEVGRWLTPDPLGLREGPNEYEYAHDNPVNEIDPNGLSGILVIYSKGNGDGSSGSGGLSGHSWISYTPDNTGKTTTYGTWGNNPQGLGNGLYQNLESGWSGDTSRSTYIDDQQESTLMNTINQYQQEGSNGWQWWSPCSTFASDAWNNTTGESLNPYGPYSNPSTLVNSINNANNSINYDGTIDMGGKEKALDNPYSLVL